MSWGTSGLWSSEYRSPPVFWAPCSCLSLGWSRVSSYPRFSILMTPPVHIARYGPYNYVFLLLPHVFRETKSLTCVFRFLITCRLSVPPLVSVLSVTYGGSASGCTRRPGSWWRSPTSDFTRHVLHRSSLRVRSAVWTWPFLFWRTSASCSSHMYHPVKRTVSNTCLRYFY